MDTLIIELANDTTLSETNELYNVLQEYKHLFRNMEVV